MWTFIIGFISGIFCFLIVAFLILSDFFKKVVPSPRFIDQFQPLRIPQELKTFLRSHTSGQFVWESCLSLSLLLHFLFQEHKDTRYFRRWVYKKLQLELNDVTTRSAASRIIQGIQVRDLSLGTEFPVIKNIRVERFEMSKNNELFNEISFEVDVDYRGGFETSVDVNMIFNSSANLSIKVIKLSGKARFILSRQPFAHWCFAFTEEPQLDFKIDSQFQGRQLKHIIPLITTAFRKAFQRKHVWPNYKIRYRPFLPHPFLQPSPPISSFDHIKINGTGLEVTVLQCTRLNTKICSPNHTDVFCTVSLDPRPFLNNSQSEKMHCITVMLTFVRKGTSDPIGLVFSKNTSSDKSVKVSFVEANSIAEKCGFKNGDVLLAINNVSIRNEKQAFRLLSGTTGDLFVLVQRDLNFYFEDEIDEAPCNSKKKIFCDDDFICVNKKSNEKLDEVFLNLNKSQNEISKSKNFKNIHKSNTTINDITSKKLNEQDFNCIETENLNLFNENKEIFKEKSDFKKDFYNKIEIKSNSYNLKEEQRLFRSKSTRTINNFVLKTKLNLVRSRSDSDLFFGTFKVFIKNSSKSSISSKEMFNSVDSVQNFSSINNSLKNDKVYNEKQNNKKIEKNIDNDLFDNTLYIDELDSKSIVKSFSTTSLTEKSLTKNKDECQLDSPKLSLRKDRIHARASEVASKIHAGRAKFNDLIWNRTKKKNTLEISSGTSPLNVLPNVTENEVTEFTSDEASFVKNNTTIGNNNVSSISKNEGNKEKISLSSLELPINDKFKKKWMKKMRKSPISSVKNFNEIPSGSQVKNLNMNNSIDCNDPNKDNLPLINSRSTKFVTLTANPLWGQSLHFGLEKRTTKYLNVMVYSQKKSTLPTSKDELNKEKKDSLDATLLGYTSIYIPQIVEDCQLTLTNSHREIFHLLPPNNENSEVFLEYPELSRKTGFDSRLCFGDIALGFRFFPQGLPDCNIRIMSPLSNLNDCKYKTSTETNYTVLSNDYEKEDESTKVTNNQILLDVKSNRLILKYSHKWISINFKHGFSYPCGICRGKIWLKWASRCTICNFICHNKCVEKANNQHECIPNSPINDNPNFLVFEDKDFETSNPTINFSNHSESTASNFFNNSGNATTRRRRIANTVSEKLTSTLKNVGVVASSSTRRKPSVFKQQTTPPFKVLEPSSSSSFENTKFSKNKEDIDSVKNEDENFKSVSIDNILDPNFILSLNGSKNLLKLHLEPGNTYNPVIINIAKSEGRNVFSDVADFNERKLKINEQIDKIQMEIDRLTLVKRNLISCSSSSLLITSTITKKNQKILDLSSKSSSNINKKLEMIGIKYEALALIMLFYCAGLSDCIEKEEINLTKKQESDQESTHSNKSLIIFDESFENDVSD